MPGTALKERADLPPPSAELVLWRCSVQAFMQVCGPRKAEKFLRVLTGLLAQEENLSSVLQIRPASEREEVRKVRRQAAEIYSRYLPLFVAGLPKD